MDVKLVTLKTNHTLIAKVETPFDQSYVLVKEPLQVALQPTKEGSGVMFVPFVEYAEEFKTGFKISMSDVLMISTPLQELQDNYQQIFSNIQIASAMPRI